jgi:poly(3-hydroxybutyrate) depolymerase
MHRKFTIAWSYPRSAVVCLALVALAACDRTEIEQLPALGVLTSETSVSGISSGAYMAGQFQFAHAKDVVGAAIIAGGPYGCAESVFADIMPGPGAAFLNLSKAINGCMLNALMAFGVPNPPMLADKARRMADAGRIDPVADVVRDRVYFFSGTEDHTVAPPIVRAAVEFYKILGVPVDSMRLVDTLPSGHAFVTEDNGLACDATGRPYIVDCDYDQAGELLSHIYGTLAPRAAEATGRYLTFDQSRFLQDLDNHGMSSEGVVYVPKACQEGEGCRVHIAFHGCAQSRAVIGESFFTGTGFARWADTNRLIVLYPQVAVTPMNPQGCWDWWGYTGHNYLTKEGVQIVAAKRMLERLGEPRPAQR